MMKKHRKIKARIPYLIIILCVVLCSCNRSDVAETDTEIDQVVENEKSTAESKSDDAENHSIVWVTDNNLHWSETKSAKIKQVLNDNGWSEPEEVTVISLKDDLLLEKLQEMHKDFHCSILEMSQRKCRYESLLETITLSYQVTMPGGQISLSTMMRLNFRR